MIALDRVGVAFGGLRALHDVSFEVRAGERVALIGPSGAGKSTLLSLINGAQAPTHGQVRVGGHDWAALDARGRRAAQARIGMVYQQFHLVGPLSVLHNINAGRLAQWSLPRALASLLVPQLRTDARALLARVGLEDRLDQRVDTLSGGQQQRVALARVLAQNPDVILADEPVASVDPERGREMIGLLRDVCLRAGKTLLVSLHSLDTLSTHFDRVIALRHGQVAFDVPAGAVSRAQLDTLYQL
jgi:phosphonate transport system ATP-binding protein